MRRASSLRVLYLENAEKKTLTGVVAVTPPPGRGTPAKPSAMFVVVHRPVTVETNLFDGG